MDITVDKENPTPLYKQLVTFVIDKIRTGEATEGEILPSMNELSEFLDISKETVKKAYFILRDTGYIEARQGKGYFVMNPKERQNQKVLLLFDKLSTYKDILFNSMSEKIGDRAQLTIRLHNQSVELLKYYLDESLDRFDWYVVTPHFPLDETTQKAVLKQMKRIPNRKLIMLDHDIKGMSGNYGSVYQDFDNDIYNGLLGGLEDLRKIKRLNVVTMSSSLYHETISSSIRRFCSDYGINVEFHSTVTENMVSKGEAYILLNGQLDSELNKLAKTSVRKGLTIGKDISIISYNDSPINELVLGGLTTVSADFSMMGNLAAEMILNKEMTKIKCDFKMVRRATF